MQNLVKEFQIKSSAFSAALRAGDYDYARDLYISLTGYFTGIEDRFKIPGKSINYVFSPLYCSTVSLVIAFRIEVIESGEKLNLGKNEIAEEKAIIKNLSTQAIAWIKDIEQQHHQYVNNKLSQLNADYDENTKSINKVLQFNHFYMSNVIIYIQIWQQFTQSSLIATPSISLNFPGLAAGIFYKVTDGRAKALSGLELATTITPGSQVESIVTATLYDTIESSEDSVRPTAVEVVYPTHKVDMGYFGAPDDLQVAPHPLKAVSDQYDHLNTLEVQTWNFVTHFTLTSEKGASASAGRPGNSGKEKLSLECPYRIGLLYVPDDEIGYNSLQSGHQMRGIARGVVFDNKLAAAYVQQSLLKFISAPS